MLAIKEFAVATILTFALCCDSKAASKINATTIAVAPYGIVTDEKTQGVYYEFMNLVLAELGEKYSNTVLPYARIAKDLTDGRADITIMFRYEHLAKDLMFVTALPKLTNVVLGKKSLNIDSPKDLLGKQVAYLRGAKFSSMIDKDPRIRKYYTVDINQAVALLGKNRVDAVIGPLSPIIYAVEQQKFIDELGHPLVISHRVPWLQISKKSPLIEQIEVIRTIAQRLIAQGKLRELKDKYRSKEARAWLKGVAIKDI